MKKNNIFVLIVSIFVLSFCISCNLNKDINVDKSSPIINSIFPDSMMSNGPGVYITIKGSNFILGSTVVFNGTEISTTVKNSNEIEFWLSSETSTTSEIKECPSPWENSQSALRRSIATPNEIDIYVKNPDGGDSNSVTFTISDYPVLNNPVLISNISGNSTHPAIVMGLNNDRHIVFDNDINDNKQIYFSTSSDNGDTWTNAKNISNSSGQAQRCDIAINESGTIFATWDNNLSDNFSILFSRSSDKGNNWTTPKNISNLSGASYRPDIIVGPSGTLHVTFHDYTSGRGEILYLSSNDNGDTWSTPYNIITNTTRTKTVNKTSNKQAEYSYSYYAPQIMSYINGDLFIAYNMITYRHDYYYWDIVGQDVLMSKLYNNEKYWGYPTLISDPDLKKTNYPSVNLYCIGQVNISYAGTSHYRNSPSPKNTQPGLMEVFLRSSNDLGSNWGTIKKVSEGSGNAGKSKVVIDAVGNMYVLWESTSNTGEVSLFCNRSIDGGVSFLGEVKLVDNFEPSSFFNGIPTKGGSLELVYVSKSGGENQNIYYIK